ncbi:DUF6783 domain-containing protein [Blautia sp.]
MDRVKYSEKWSVQLKGMIFQTPPNSSPDSRHEFTHANMTHSYLLSGIFIVTPLFLHSSKLSSCEQYCQCKCSCICDRPCIHNSVNSHYQ